VQVKNKPCVEYTVIMHLISWIHSRGSETTNFISVLDIGNKSLAIIKNTGIPCIASVINPNPDGWGLI
jgi:hypothetical protein